VNRADKDTTGKEDRDGQKSGKTDSHSGLETIKPLDAKGSATKKLLPDSVST
jgi:hypothetical protein